MRIVIQGVYKDKENGEKENVYDFGDLDEPHSSNLLKRINVFYFHHGSDAWEYSQSFKLDAIYDNELAASKRKINAMKEQIKQLRKELKVQIDINSLWD